MWEANHVWLIFLVVLLFTCFPAAYAAGERRALLAAPLWLLIGIVLRGAAYVFRAYAAGQRRDARRLGPRLRRVERADADPAGMCLGALSTGDPCWYDPFRSRPACSRC